MNKSQLMKLEAGDTVTICKNVKEYTANTEYVGVVNIESRRMRVVQEMIDSAGTVGVVINLSDNGDRVNVRVGCETWCYMHDMVRYVRKTDKKGSE